MQDAEGGDGIAGRNQGPRLGPAGSDTLPPTDAPSGIAADPLRIWPPTVPSTTRIEVPDRSMARRFGAGAMGQAE